MSVETHNSYWNGRPMAALSSAPAVARGYFDAALFQHDFVTAQRAKGVSWQNIANMLGRSTISVRKQFDPAYVEPGESAPHGRVVIARMPVAAAERPVAYGWHGDTLISRPEAAHG